MADTYPQFTPAQILEAGQRAMAEGRTEYAVQFFRHLIEHYGATPEAGAARDALARLRPGAEREPWRLSQMPMAQPETPTLHAQAAGSPADVEYGSYRSDHNANGRTAPPNGQLNGKVNGRAHNGHGKNGHSGYDQTLQTLSVGHGADGAVQSAAVLRDGRPQAGQVPAPPAQAPDPGPSSRQSPAPARSALPAPENNYFTGRLMALLAIVIGALMMVLAVVLIVGAAGGPQLLSIIGVRTAPGAALAGPVMLGAGIFVFLLGQMARALFDGVNAVRDLAMIERLRAQRG